MQFDATLTQDYRDTMFKGTSLLTFVPVDAGKPQFQLRAPLSDANALELGAIYKFNITKSETQPPEEI